MGPKSGVCTGTAKPTNSVSVLVPKSVTHRFPLASMATAKGSTMPASKPQPVEGESAAPGLVAADPANSLSTEDTPVAR